ncbi:MAG: nodulation protein NfeD [Deltaproteobacteria bacterium]|nr:nodulation protein NfeD [Deltaproteobacteria bacterium]
MSRLVLGALACSLLAVGIAVPPAFASHVNVVTISGSINPASSDYIQQAIEQSENEAAAALLIELDTPGGLLASTKDIIQAILNSRVPVVVFVSPRGAWAASAGTFITLAGHVAAMAPGTSIGAASPVSISGGGGGRGEDDERTDVSMEKAEKFTMAFIESIAKERDRNVEWALSSVRTAEAVAQDEALELGVIDLIADDRSDLLAKIDGMTVRTSAGEVQLDLANAEIRQIEMPPLTRLFNYLASPDVAMILVMVGMLGLYIEFQQPGMLLPGIAGAICLVLAAIAFQILPFSWVGLMLIVLGMMLMIAELFVTSFGLLFAGGILCFLLGGMMLFDMPEVSDLTVSFWSVLLPTVAGFAVCAGVVLYAVGRSFLAEPVSGVDEMLGSRGTAATTFSPEGKVFVRGEYWTADADGEVSEGDAVEVTAVEGMRLRVRRARPTS